MHLLERAAEAGAELAVFPELALTTFFPRWELDDPREIDEFYETQMPSPRTRPLFDAARRLKIGFALGYAELSEEGGSRRRFNSMDLVGADGALIGRYRKIHVPGSAEPEAGVTTHLERRYFEPGNLRVSRLCLLRRPHRPVHLQRSAMAGNVPHAMPERCAGAHRLHTGRAR